MKKIVEGVGGKLLSFLGREKPCSQFNKYKGYSKPLYHQLRRTSDYLTVRDGTKLAFDLFRPVQNGKVVTKPLPVIWTHYRYHRADLKAGRFKEWIANNPWLKVFFKYIPFIENNNKFYTQLDKRPWVSTLITHGYIIAVVDVRGGGASYGTSECLFNESETADAYDITEWFAGQSWSNGCIGMFGMSYMGITQYLAASTSPPHLKAIFPEMALFDLYDFIYPGGVFRHQFASIWGSEVEQLDKHQPAAPVDQDNDRSMLREAIEQHQTNRNIFELLAGLPFRDSTDPILDQQIYTVCSPSGHLEKIKQSKIPIYHLAGWYDAWCRDALILFNNLNNPQKIVIGPWSHLNIWGFDLACEHLRWYDYWLKGIDNKVICEAPIHYYVIGAAKGEQWRAAWQWPIPNVISEQYYFHSPQTETLNSVNSGFLSSDFPISNSGKDYYTVDYTTTSGTGTRWANVNGAAFAYPNMKFNDLKALTYTTIPLSIDTEVTGHPIVHLWITSTHNDGDFFVYLEDVDSRGNSSYVTEGVLRASHRRLSEPCFNQLGLPYHRSFTSDIIDLPNTPVELIFDLHPISYVFRKGNRLRVALTCADSDNAFTPKLSPPPQISLYRNANYPSGIILPIAEPE